MASLSLLADVHFVEVCQVSDSRATVLPNVMTKRKNEEDPGIRSP